MIRRHTKQALLAAALIGLGSVTSAQAALTASATVAVKSINTSVSPTQFTYAVTLNDTGTTNVGSFWYAWIPGQDYLTTSPLTVVSPAGWQSLITTGGTPGVTNGYAIQWKASTGTTPIASGGLLTGFEFTTIDNLASISGNSAYYSTTPVGTSFIYSGAPFSDAGFQFVAQAVPEPTLLATLPVTMIALRRRSRRAEMK